MEQPTYKEQYDKIVRAYLRNELEPFENCACFIGNLLNGTTMWSVGRKASILRETTRSVITGSIKTHLIGVPVCEVDSGACLRIAKISVKAESHGLYEFADIMAMEQNFLFTYLKDREDWLSADDSLFHALYSTLEMLRLIHISKGEDVDAIPLTKRVLEVA